MERRTFIAGLGSAAAWPVAARAQAKVPVVALLSETELTPSLRAALVRGLAEAGYVEGRNVVVEEHFGLGDARLREMAADLVRRRVAVIAAPGSQPAALAAKAATQTIPIVFGLGTDPVRIGLVPSLNQPGGNVTGYTELNTDVWSKRFGMLRALTPAAARYGVLDYPPPTNSQVIIEEARAVEKATGLPIEIISVTDDAGVEAAFSNARRVDALLVNPGPFFFARRDQIVGLAAKHRVPTAYHLSDYPRIGGLMSYGSSLAEMHRQVGIYSGRVLQGTKPADLPVARATKFELVINAKTAATLGLEIPPALLALADEVIE